MTEKSFFWTGTTLGDHGPISDLQFQDILKDLLTYTPEVEGVLGVSGSTSLEVTNPSGTDITVGGGYALVDGIFYTEPAQRNYTFPSDLPYVVTFRIVLRKDFAAGNVRLKILVDCELNDADPQFNIAYPVVYGTNIDPINNETYWDIPLAYGILFVMGSAVYLEDSRIFCNFGSYP